MTASEKDKALAEAIRKTVEVAGQAKDFVLEQAPDVVQQYLAWHFWSSIIVAALMLVLCFTFLTLARVFLKKHREVEAQAKAERIAYYSNDWGVGVGVFCVMATAVMVPFTINVLEAVKIAIAPKVYLLEALAKLVH